MIHVQKTLQNHLPQKLQNTWLARLLGYVLARILKEKAINAFICENQHLKGYDFIDAVLDYFQFSYQASVRDKEAVPTTGRCIIVANHPLGALDSLALLHMVLNVRSDVRIVANELLSSLGSLDEYLLPINNLSGEPSGARMSAIHQALAAEQAVIIFPAGEVSRAKWLTIRDKTWSKGFYLFAKRAKADIVPVFISGKNSFWFYAWAKISSLAALLLLPRQMWRQRNKVITLKVGTPLPFSMISQLPIDDKQKIKLLKKHVYQLGKNRKGLFAVPDPVAHPERRNDLRLAINNCEILGRSGDDQRILLFETQENSPLLREIGRLRELTFRQVGEGSQQRRDLDKYDSYYDHLIIWNDKDLEVMGAYRLIPAKKYFKTQKTKHLYTDSLFDYQGDSEWLTQGLELGRSFVQPKYWGSRSLDYLWQGIGAYYVRHPEVRYLFGTVSISANYPKEAIDYLVAFYSHYFNPEKFSAKAVVKSHNPYQLSEQKQRYFKKLFADTEQKTAYRTMKMHLREMNLVIPTLFKHYSELCKNGGVVFTDFGVDPDFADCVDGFVIVDLQKIKANKHARYIAPFLAQDGEALNRNDSKTHHTTEILSNEDNWLLPPAKGQQRQTNTTTNVINT